MVSSPDPQEIVWVRSLGKGRVENKEGRKEEVSTKGVRRKETGKVRKNERTDRSRTVTVTFRDGIYYRKTYRNQTRDNRSFHLNR